MTAIVPKRKRLHRNNKHSCRVPPSLPRLLPSPRAPSRSLLGLGSVRARPSPHPLLAVSRLSLLLGRLSGSLSLLSLLLLCSLISLQWGSLSLLSLSLMVRSSGSRGSSLVSFSARLPSVPFPPSSLRPFLLRAGSPALSLNFLPSLLAPPLPLPPSSMIALPLPVPSFSASPPDPPHVRRLTPSSLSSFLVSGVSSLHLILFLSLCSRRLLLLSASLCLSLFVSLSLSLGLFSPPRCRSLSPSSSSHLALTRSSHPAPLHLPLSCPLAPAPSPLFLPRSLFLSPPPLLPWMCVGKWHVSPCPLPLPSPLCSAVLIRLPFCPSPSPIPSLQISSVILFNESVIWLEKSTTNEEDMARSDSGEGRGVPLLDNTKGRVNVGAKDNSIANPELEEPPLEEVEPSTRSVFCTMELPDKHLGMQLGNVKETLVTPPRPHHPEQHVEDATLNTSEEPNTPLSKQQEETFPDDSIAGEALCRIVGENEVAPSIEKTEGEDLSRDKTDIEKVKVKRSQRKKVNHYRKRIIFSPRKRSAALKVLYSQKMPRLEDDFKAEILAHRIINSGQ
ncbi:hypothetical protein C7M84_021653 [Penaeus vannamei]|uniref:Uncharacterized protein n=1 Tax=Penaeus vannamei TaxID=6689 RepID=A0A3R7LPA1_PENVA|nr:hypothetical protein C7M84_021653 [Penaeus vannamei]